VPIAVVAAEGEGRETASTGTAALVGQEGREQTSEIDNLEGNAGGPGEGIKSDSGIAGTSAGADRSRPRTSRDSPHALALHGLRLHQTFHPADAYRCRPAMPKVLWRNVSG
jgi:hypothetical protein